MTCHNEVAFQSMDISFTGSKIVLAMKNAIGRSRPSREVRSDTERFKECYSIHIYVFTKTTNFWISLLFCSGRAREIPQRNDLHPFSNLTKRGSECLGSVLKGIFWGIKVILCLRIFNWQISGVDACPPKQSTCNSTIRIIRIIVSSVPPR